jgi:hypothetical protein
MTPNPATMTVQECMDFVALQNPIYMVTRGGAKGPRGEPVDLWLERLNAVDWFVIEGEEGWPKHPLQPTLDAAAAAMPEFDVMSVTVWPKTTTKMGVVFDPCVTCIAYKGDDVNNERLRGVLGKAKADTELLARWRLVVACMMAEKGGGNGH